MSLCSVRVPPSKTNSLYFFERLLISAGLTLAFKRRQKWEFTTPTPQLQVYTGINSSSNWAGEWEEGTRCLPAVVCCLCVFAAIVDNGDSPVSFAEYVAQEQQCFETVVVIVAVALLYW